MPSTPFPALNLGRAAGFVAGSRVHTREGLEPIQDIRPGDWVLTQTSDPAPPRRRRASEYLYRQVLRVGSTDTPSTVLVELKNLADGLEDHWVAGPGQPIWTRQWGWLAADQLRSGHALVLSLNGNALVMRVRQVATAARLHTIEVDGPGSFYVGTLGAWVSGDPAAAPVISPEPPAVPAAHKPTFDFSQAQTLLKIENYYNDTLAEPSTPGGRTDAARHVLQTYAQGGRIEGGWLYATALQQSRLDFSPESLTRLDHLLASIRARARPTAAQLQHSEAGRNFCSLLAYFLIEVLRRRSGAEIEWHDRASALAELPDGTDLPDTPAARLVALAPDQSALFLPLGWVQAQALGEGAPVPAAEYLQSLVALLERHRTPMPWFAGMRALGRIASWQMMTVAGGHPVRPLMCDSTAPNTWIEPMTELVGGGDLNGAFEMVADWLQKNPRGADWQVVCYDGRIDLAGERIVALIVILYTHGTQPLRIKTAFPYRPARDGQAFAILAPRLREATVSNEQVAVLDAAMERGIQSITWTAGRSWKQFRTEEAAAPAQPAAPSPASSAACFLEPSPAQPDLAEILAELRTRFEQRQQRMSALSLASVLGPKPAWVQPTDGLNAVFEHQQLLLSEGHLVWGALVQANNLMFKPGDANCPGLLVYSPDPYFDAHPLQLQRLARAFLALKGTQPEHPDLRALAQLATNEAGQMQSLVLPRVLAPQEIRTSAFMLFRQHIPNAVMGGSLFPLLTHRSTPAVLMLPFEFWPIELIIRWKEGRL